MKTAKEAADEPFNLSQHDLRAMRKETDARADKALLMVAEEAQRREALILKQRAARLAAQGQQK